VKIPPAFATRTSTGPGAPSISLRILSRSAKIVRSPVTPRDTPPAEATSERVSLLLRRDRGRVPRQLRLRPRRDGRWQPRFHVTSR